MVSMSLSAQAKRSPARGRRVRGEAEAGLTALILEARVSIHFGVRQRDPRAVPPNVRRSGHRIGETAGSVQGLARDADRRTCDHGGTDGAIGPTRASREPRSVQPNPALLEHARERAESVQNRIADRITAFAGSMKFVYLHLLWFGAWIIFGVEGYPYGLLTMIVSLEAIFLSTFVMISQNRADAKRSVVADLQWQTVQEEDTQNRELLNLSSQILELTKAIHAQAHRPAAGT